jgi:hypothetical protein
MMDGVKGSAILRVNEVLTALFTITAFASVIVFQQPWKAIAVAVAIVCFSVGVVVFLWGYWVAVQRSRTANIAVASLYFLTDKCAPKSVAVRMNSVLAGQVVIGVATALMRSTTDGKAGSTLAFGILVPVLGLGMNGLWGALHGDFSPRNVRKSTGVPPEDPASGQDDGHD